MGNTETTTVDSVVTEPVVETVVESVPVETSPEIVQTAPEATPVE